jgi:hypothetical protein
MDAVPGDAPLEESIVAGLNDLVVAVENPIRRVVLAVCGIQSATARDKCIRTEGLDTMGAFALLSGDSNVTKMAKDYGIKDCGHWPRYPWNDADKEDSSPCFLGEGPHHAWIAGYPRDVGQGCNDSGNG